MGELEVVTFGLIDRGYSTIHSPVLGALSDTQFTHKANNYTITILYRRGSTDVDNPSELLYIAFANEPDDPAPSGGVVSSWTLDLGSGRTFAFNTFSSRLDGSGDVRRLFQKSNPGFDWADTETHTVKIIGNTCDD